MNIYQLERDHGLDYNDATQGMCRQCETVYVWSRKALGGLAGQVCPVHKTQLERTSRLSTKRRVLIGANGEMTEIAKAGAA